MNWKKNRPYILLILPLFLLAFLLVQKITGQEEESYQPKDIRKIFSKELLAKTKPGKFIVVNLINKYDCINCGNVARYYISSILPHTVIPAENVFVVTNPTRKIEEQLLINQLNIDTIHSTFLANDVIYMKLNQQLPQFGGSSFLIIYSPEGERVFARSYKELNL